MELAMPEQARIEIDQNGLSRCVAGELVYEPDMSEIMFPFPQRLSQWGLRSMVAAPLLVESSRFSGVLVAARRQTEGFSSSDCEFLTAAQRAYVALAARHQAKQVDEALHQAYNDLRQTQHTVMQQERLEGAGPDGQRNRARPINNAISPVALYTGKMLLEQETNLNERTREYLETTRRSIEDVAHTVARMREFYRQRESQVSLTPVDLNLPHPAGGGSHSGPVGVDIPLQRGIVIEYLRTELASKPARDRWDRE